ncbi:protein NIM1-INTERACTING 2 [Artemisia annua]|uniref:Protein NIM1-INTERACTING 2 n=1 Tax=Artemisia annua TaxID=35608 RepID=A0A2U1LM88_ARTAN|nr:protein NIM1-INTERACTING 2 [Artemisia annua]
MDKDQRKRSKTVDGGGSDGDRKKGKEVVSVVPPTEDEVEEFFAILRRMRDAIKYLEKGGDGGVKLPEAAREGVEGEVCEKKRADVVLLDLNTVPDDEK